MPKKTKNDIIQCEYFRWILVRRGGVWYGDGRSDAHRLGRFSLDTRDKTMALDRLKNLDRVKAVDLGLADPAIHESGDVSNLDIDNGIALYLQHVSRPEVLGGASPATVKRYRAVFDKLREYCSKKGVLCWNSVTKPLVTSYLSHLNARKYADRTIYLEGTTVKQAIKWFAEEHLIPRERIFGLRLQKPRGTPTYCYTFEQVQAMADHCFARPRLVWLGRIIVALAHTGLRISELLALRWTDIDFDANVILIANDPDRVPGSSTLSALT